MYLQTSRLQYNLQKVGVFQKALSKIIFKQQLVGLLYHKSFYSSRDRRFITLSWAERGIITGGNADNRPLCWHNVGGGSALLQKN